MPNLDAIRKKMMKEKCTVPRFHTLSNGVICTTARPTGGRFRIYSPVHQPTLRRDEGTAETQDKTTGTSTHSGTDETYRARGSETTRTWTSWPKSTASRELHPQSPETNDGTIHTIAKLNLSSRNFQMVTKDRGSIAPKLKIKCIKPYSNNKV